MKRLGTVKKIVFVLLLISIFAVIFFEIKYHTLLALLAWIFHVWEAPGINVVELIAIVQCINLSIALYILCILDKHLIPIY